MFLYSKVKMLCSSKNQRIRIFSKRYGNQPSYDFCYKKDYNLGYIFSLSVRNCTEIFELITESIPEAIVDFENRRSVCRWASYKYKEKRLEEIVRRLPTV